MKKNVSILIFLIIFSGLITLTIGKASVKAEDQCTSSMLPLDSALHLLPPLASASGDISDFDRTLTDFLTVSICQVMSNDPCDIIEEFNSMTGKGMESIKLQDVHYHVNWIPSKTQVKKEYEVIFSVAELEVGTFHYIARNTSAVPIKFRIDNHPRIRARVLHAMGYTATEIAVALIDEFNTCCSVIAKILYEEEFTAIEIGETLRDVFSMSAQEVADCMWTAEIPSIVTGEVLKSVFMLNDQDSATILRLAGYNAREVWEALKIVFSVHVKYALDLLMNAGFSRDEAFVAIMDDLLAWYDTLIEKYGPVVYLHTHEQYKMSSVDWFLDRTPLLYLQNNTKYTYPDLVNPSNLIETVETLKAGGADRFWFGLTSKSGDQGSAKAYVQVVQPKNDKDVFDIQFWFFYPYNGPGSFYLKAELCTAWNCETMEDGDDQPSDYGNTNPLGTHYGDWEAVILRFNTASETLSRVYMSAHGEYTPYELSNLEFMGDHVIAYSSLNGHANFPKAGKNGHVEFESEFDDLGKFFYFHFKGETLNWTNSSPVYLSSSSAYEFVGIDEYMLDSSRNLIDSSWINFPGRWGPYFEFNLSWYKKYQIIDSIWHDGINDIRAKIPSLAASGCAVLAAPCVFFYPACFVGCFAGLVTLVESGLDIALLASGKEIVDGAFPDQSMDGPTSPANKTTIWEYYYYPNEQAIVEIATPLSCDPLQQPSMSCQPESGNVAIEVIASLPTGTKQVEVGIDGVFFDTTFDSLKNAYTYDWDTVTYSDGIHELNVRAFDYADNEYSYSGNAVNIEVCNGCISIGDLVLSEQSIPENSNLSLNGSFSSLYADEHVATINWGDGTVESVVLVPGVRNFLAEHTYTDDNPSETSIDVYNISVKVEGGGKEATKFSKFDIYNIDPDVESMTADIVPIQIGDSINPEGVFSDAGIFDTHSATWDWGDLSTDVFNDVASPHSAVHTYEEGGVYNVKLTITDDDTGSVTATYPDYFVAYDGRGPSYGAGAGSIMATVREDTDDDGEPDTDVDAEANFGFEYNENFNQFEFRLKIREVEFFSENLEEINNLGSSVEIKCIGTMNDELDPSGEPYQFLLTVSDDTTDTFQIKITWIDEDGNEQIYETVSGQELLEGEIIIK